VLVVTLLFAVSLHGQEVPEPDAPTAMPDGWSVMAADAMTTEQGTQYALAVRARNDMVTVLVTRLMNMLADEGPARAVEICAQMAPQIAEQIEASHGLRIGRTSVRLRNPENGPPAWAVPAVSEELGVEQIYSGPSGELGLLSPIRLVEFCTNCHGTRDQLGPGVFDTLAARYPLDEATGFAPGDLRGWFWVEVPVAAEEPASQPASQPAEQ